MPKTCFVIGPIGDAGTPIRAHADDLLKYIVAPVVEQHGYDTPVRADKMGEPGRITTQIIRELERVDLVVADLTFANANVYYELSLRHALRKPSIHMAHEDTKLSFDIADNRTIFFTMHAKRVDETKVELSKHIEHVLAPGYKVTNPITEALEAISFERSDKPVEKAIGEMMVKFDAMVNAIGRLRDTVYVPQSILGGGRVTDASLFATAPSSGVVNDAVLGSFAGSWPPGYRSRADFGERYFRGGPISVDPAAPIGPDEPSSENEKA